MHSVIGTYKIKQNVLIERNNKMAIAVTTPGRKQGFIANATSADASACEELVAAVASKIIKVRHLTINSTDAISITIGSGEVGGAVEAALLGPIAFSALQTMQWNFNPYMELPVGKSLTVDADGAGAICVFVQGVVE
jgi:hypothetical protein